MENQDTDPLAIYRTPRVISASFMLAGTALFIVSMCSIKKTDWVIPLAVYLGYLTVAGAMLTLIAGRLFRQHEFRKLKLDLATMLLLLTLLSLPLGVANFFVSMIAHQMGEKQNEITLATIPIIGCLFFQLIPVLLIAEALFAWRGKWHRRNSED